MGYWWPPSLFAFDPTERALIFDVLSIDDAVPRMAPYIGVSEDQARQILSGSKRWIVPSEYDMEAFPWGDIPLFVPRGRASKVNGYARYIQMIVARSDKDPSAGGLPPDVVLENGDIVLGYWDFSNDDDVRRKEVTYVKDEKAGGFVIANRSDREGGVPRQWNVQKKTWEKEGADAEREFGKGAAPILDSIFTITAAIAGAFGGAELAAFSAAWTGLAKNELRNGGKPPSFDDVMAAVKTAGGAAIGRGAWGILSKNDALQGIMRDGFITKIAQGDGSYSDKLAAAVTDISGYMPRIPLGSPGLVPNFNFEAWAKGAAKGMPPPSHQNVVLGIPQAPVTLSDLDQLDVRRKAFDWAWKAFVEPDPGKRLQIRRNFLWSAVDNSSAVNKGDAQGWAHGETEQDKGLLDAGAYFDQHLSALIGSAFKEVSSLGTIGEEAMAAGRQADEGARAALYKVIGDLRGRYKMP